MAEPSHYVVSQKPDSKTHIMCLFMFRVDKSIATESTWVVDRLWGRGRRSDCLSEQDSLMGWWNVLEMDGGEGCMSLGNTKCHWIAHFMFMLYDHYFKKIILCMVSVDLSYAHKLLWISCHDTKWFYESSLRYFREVLRPCYYIISYF